MTAQKGLRIVFAAEKLQKVLLYLLLQKGEGAKIITKGRHFSDWTHSANEASCSRKKKPKWIRNLQVMWKVEQIAACSDNEWMENDSLNVNQIILTNGGGNSRRAQPTFCLCAAR